MKQDEAIKKRKVWAILVWTFLYIIYSIWGNTDLQPTGLEVDSAGNIYLSLIDTYRDEARVSKLNSNGKLIWSRTFQGKNLSIGEKENILINSTDAIFQIISKLGENSSYLTVLCYHPNGELRWSKELFGVPYYKEFAIDGDDLVIAGLDNDKGSFKINRINPNGGLAESLYIYNPVEAGQVRFSIIKDGLLVAGVNSSETKLAAVDWQGKTFLNSDLKPGLFLGADFDTHIYFVPLGNNFRIEKYTASPVEQLWSVLLSRPQQQPFQPVVVPRYIEFDQHLNLYLTGKDQVLTWKWDLIKARYSKGVRYQIANKLYFRTRGGDRIFLTKLNRSGRILYWNHLKTYQSNPLPRGIAVDHAENVYITGSYTLLDSQKNLFIAKYNHNGKLLWVKRNPVLPASLFYIGLIGTLLAISVLNQDSFWKVELLILIGYMLFFGGLAII